MLSTVFAPSTVSDDCFSKSWMADTWVDYLIVWGHSYGIRALEFSRLNTQGVIISRSLCVVAETCSVLLCVCISRSRVLQESELGEGWEETNIKKISIKRLQENFHCILD